MPERFIGRETELTLLNTFIKKATASLLVIHGRRRVGKSRLIDEFVKHKKYYRFTGLAPNPGVTAQSQREEFARRLNTYFNVPGLKADNWADLFTIVANHCRQGQVIVVLDEISWMAMDDGSFLSQLKNAWDEEFKQNPKLILIVCGSISSWIDKNILSSTGFVGRVNHVLTLKELPLKDCIQFWGKYGNNISAYEKFKFLSVSGGIPLYLEAMDPRQTAEANIHKLCFLPGSLLSREFDNIFTHLFTKRSTLYSRIVKVLANGMLEAKEICEQLKIGQTGWVSEHLDDLEKFGFITRDYSWHFASGVDSKISRYRLSDNYVRFYLKYIQKNLNKIQRGTFTYSTLSALPNWEAIVGLQFENVILRNRQYVQKYLHVKPNEIISDNPFYQKRSKTQQGCQIDYLIQTKFNNLYVCEIRFSKKPITAKIIGEVQAKIDNLTKPKGFSSRPVLIHVNGITTDVLEAEYFSDIISFEDLLNKNQE